MDDQTEPTEEADIAGGWGSLRVAAPCLPRTTTRAATNDEKPIVNVDDDFDGSFLLRAPEPPHQGMCTRLGIAIPIVQVQAPLRHHIYGTSVAYSLQATINTSATDQRLGELVVLFFEHKSSRELLQYYFTLPPIIQCKYWIG